MGKFGQEASYICRPVKSPSLAGDSRYATDSPAHTVHHQNLQVSCKGLHIIYQGSGLEIFRKSSLQKSLPRPKNMTKESFPRMQLLQKVSRMLKKFIYLSGKVLLLFKTLNFQNEINSKIYTSLNEHLTKT